MSDDKRTAEEWGRLAVSLPGWRWMPGMEHILWGRVMEVQKRGDEWWVAGHVQPFGEWPKFREAEATYQQHVAITDEGCTFETRDAGSVPNPDDPATEGCMFRLLGPVCEGVWYTGDCDRWVVEVGEERRLYTSLGRACIAAAEALGRWPNGGRMVAE